MICRVAYHESSPGPVDSAAAQQFRDWIRGQPGFVAGWHAQDPTSGRVVSFTVWQSKEHMDALRDRVPPSGPIGMKPTSVEVFEHAAAF